jgi:hypothetical protein
VHGGQRIAVQWKHAIVVGTGTKIAIVPRAATIKSAAPKSLFMTSSLLGSVVYGRQSQMAKLGQQKLYVGQMTRCDFLGQLLASAGVEVTTAVVPTTAASTIMKMRSFLRIDNSPRELEVVVASGAPGFDDRHEGGRPAQPPSHHTPAVGVEIP